MTVRITTAERTDEEGAVVAVEGTLTREGAELLAEVCGSTDGGPERVAIDLAGVQFVDAEAASILCGLARAGVRFERASYFVRQIIDLAESENLRK